ncbi:substrate-binding domain-containing protein, partial [Candidatus Bathyarchaeota archaeon]|nr:substrate-binding domain-containing protein [Candidatus Bathyarchaeota archaeon]
MDRRNKRRLRLFPKQGYIMLLIGILLGFMVFLAVSAITSQGGRSGGTGQEGLPSSITFDFLYTSEKQAWIEEVTPGFEQWFFERFNITVKVQLDVRGSHDTVNQILWGAQPTAWSPASSLWIPYLNDEWLYAGGAQEIATDSTPLVLSPVVIAGWKSFLEENNVTSFQDLYQLARDGIDYKYGHPDPSLSNGGVMAEVLEFADA